MPELPDITVYIEAIEKRVYGATRGRCQGQRPLCAPDVRAATQDGGRQDGASLRRLGKRIAIGLDEELWLVVHLMIAGRLHWKPKPGKLSGKYNLAALRFRGGLACCLPKPAPSVAHRCICFRERPRSRSKTPAVSRFSRRLPAPFESVLRQRNHTLKRALTDPHLFSGIGNAYSDEILHRARLSPLALTQKLPEEDVSRLFEATQLVLREWIDRLRAEAGDGFPEKVTAFRPQMAVHGRYGEPCPVCAAPVQRIRYADNETNYCPGCQTKGRILADRSLSRLLKDDWPRNLDEL